MSNLSAAAYDTYVEQLEHQPQQTESLLRDSGVIRFLPADSKTNNITGIGEINLAEVVGRNPDKHRVDYILDGRRMSKRRFSATVTMDAKDDINELFLDPTSAIYEELRNSKDRLIDRVAVSAATGTVTIGDDRVGFTQKTAAQDGVITIDAKSGLTYAEITKLTQNFINNSMGQKMMGTLICATGVENSRLMNEDKFINQDYIKSAPVEAGIMKKTGMYSVAYFPGSVDGGIQVIDPIIPEVDDAGTSVRLCPVMTPRSVAMALKIPQDLTVEPTPNKVNSKDITIEVWLEAMRVKGQYVQILKTTTADFS